MRDAIRKRAAWLDAKLAGLNRLEDRRVLWALFALPIVALYAATIATTVNFPAFDDTIAFFEPFLAYEQAEGADAWDMLFSQFDTNVEHRVPYERGLFALLHRAGPVDFFALKTLGNLGLLPVLGCVLLLLRGRERRLLYALPVVYLLMQPQYWVIFLSAICSLSYFHSLAYSLGAIACTRARSAWGFAGAAACAALALGSFGNGLFAIAVCGLSYLQQRRWAWAVAWAAAGAAIVGVFLIGYQRPQSSWSVSSVGQAGQSALYFVLLMGSALRLGVFPGLGVAFALLFGWHLVKLARRRAWNENPTLWLFILFVLLTMGAISVARIGFGVHHAFEHRYKLFSSLLLVLGYLLFAQHAPRPKFERFFPYILAFAMLFNVVTLIDVQKHLWGYKRVWTDAVARMDQGDFNGYAPRRAHLNVVLEKAVRAGLYDPRKK